MLENGKRVRGEEAVARESLCHPGCKNSNLGTDLLSPESKLAESGKVIFSFASFFYKQQPPSIEKQKGAAETEREKKGKGEEEKKIE